MNEFSSSIQCKSSFIDSSEQPFRATFLWERIISHLERTVKIGRHSIALRWYSNCFHGSKAVDCLKAYLTTILPRPVKRSQALTLCGKLQETDVISCVKKKQEFREKGLYRFTHTHFWKTPHSRPDSDEVIFSQSILSKSRSVECLEPPSPVQRLKGYASDSTVTVSTHKRRKKIRTRKISHKSSETAVSQKKSNDTMKGRKISTSSVCRPDNTKADSQFKAHPIHPKRERWSQLREKDCHKSKQSRERRCSKLKLSRDWKALAELPPSLLDVRTIGRSHSFSSAGEMLGLDKPTPTHRHSSGKWTVYGII